jgi:hypothetical protein
MKHVKLIVLVSIIIVANIYFVLFAPQYSYKYSAPPISLNNNNINGSLLLIRGFSPYDPYDRVVNVMYNGIEVIRIITPLHRTGTLPDTFQWEINLPFNLSNTNSLTYQIWNNPNLWNITFNLLGTNGSYGVESLVPLQSLNVGYNYPITLTFITSHPNETIYILASGHATLETVPDIKFSVDGQSYTVFDWHPLSNDATLTSTGYVIPYITVNNNLTQHKLIIYGSPEYLYSTPYLIISVFGVYPKS